MSLSPENNDLGGLLAAMSQLQQELTNAESDVNAQTVIGKAAQGKVAIEASGEYSFDKVTIDPTVVDPEDLALLEDLILAALRDAVTQIKSARTTAMGGAVSQVFEGLFSGESGSLGASTTDTDE